LLKGNRKYYLIFILLFLGLAAFQFMAPKPVNWNRTYLSSHKIPFGTNALFQLLNSGFIAAEIRQEDQSVYSLLKLRAKTDSPATYLFIDNQVKFDKLDTKELMKFVSEGNTVFISASVINGLLADTFKLETDIPFNNYFSFEKDTAKEKKQETFLNFSNPRMKNKNAYGYNGIFQNNFFSSFDTLKAVVLATDQKNKTNLLRMDHGRGKFIFSSVPDVFSNYFIVNDQSREFAYKTLSYAANPVIYLDEHYKSKRLKSDSPMGYVLANDSLYAAWILALLSLLLFMLFETKRKQRIIPVIVPLKNTTLEFVEVVGSVYFSAKNHKVIAEEKIIVFLEFIRHRFQVSTRLYDEAFYRRVFLLSGITIDDLKYLFERIDRIQFKQSITESELIELNSLIDNFYKNNKR
jgi:hypothetical protein